MARADKLTAVLVAAVMAAANTPANADDWDGLFQEDAASSADSKAAPNSIELEPEASAEVAAPPRVIEEIVVSAQKTQQNMQEVPLSVSAVNAETLRESGGFDAETLENFIPNVEIDIDPQSPSLGIRGFSTDADNVGFEPAVGLLIDELALGRSEFVPDGLFDIERVETIRGPQGTLFGKNTIAGVLHFFSAEPSDQRDGQLFATWGQPQSQRLEAAASVPLSETITSRLAGVFWNQQGDTENTKLQRLEGGFEQIAGRLKLNYQPDADWSLRAQLQQSRTRVDSYPPWQLFDAPASVMSFNRHYDAKVEDDPLNHQTSFNTPGFVDRDSELYSVIAEHHGGQLWGLEGLTTTAVLGYAGFDLATIIDIDISPADIIITDFANRFSQTSLELRTVGSSQSLLGFGLDTEFVAGLYVYDANLASRLDNLAGQDLVAYGASPAGLQTLGGPDASALVELLNVLPTAPGVPIQDELLRRFRQQTRSYATFGQFTWHWSDAWGAVIGLRLGRESKSGQFNVRSVGPGIISQIVGAEPYATSLSHTETDISPKLGLLYSAAKNINTFVSWTRGFKGGGFNATSEVNENLRFEAERAQSFEAGFKSTWLDRSLRLNLSLYNTEVSNLQVVDFVNTSFRVSNAGKARLRGLEMEAAWLSPWPWLSISAGVGLSDAKYLSYRNAAPTEAQGDAGQSSQDLSGRTLANAPEMSLALSPTMTLPMPFLPDWGLRWSLDFSYRGDQYSATDLDPKSFQRGYILLGSRLVMAPQSETWAVIFSAGNLSDQRVLDMVVDHAVFDNTYFAQQIPARHFSASLMMRF